MFLSVSLPVFCQLLANKLSWSTHFCATRERFNWDCWKVKSPQRRNGSLVQKNLYFPVFTFVRFSANATQKYIAIFDISQEPFESQPLSEWQMSIIYSSYSCKNLPGQTCGCQVRQINNLNDLALNLESNFGNFDNICSWFCLVGFPQQMWSKMYYKTH